MISLNIRYDETWKEITGVRPLRIDQSVRVNSDIVFYARDENNIGKTLILPKKSMNDTNKYDVITNYFKF